MYKNDETQSTRLENNDLKFQKLWEIEDVDLQMPFEKTWGDEAPGAEKKHSNDQRTA